MAIVITDDAHYKKIAKTIRDYAESPDVVMVPDAMPDVMRETFEYVRTESYAAGHSDAWEEGFGKGYTEGKQAEQDRFWDAYQQNGKRTDYTYAFYNWPGENYNPKYFIAGGVSNCFRGSTITDALVPIVATGSTANAFYNCSAIVTIPSLDLSDSTNLSYVFQNCSELVSVTFVGEIKLSGLDLHYSNKLSKWSIESLVGELSDATSGLSVTLSVDAVDRAFQESSRDAEGNVILTAGSNSTAWAALVNTKPNWTINLV